MDELEHKLIRNINGPGIYFAAHVKNKTLALIQRKLKKTVIGVFSYNNEKLAIEIKGQKASEEELFNDLKPFILTPNSPMDIIQYDMIIDSEKFLRNLFKEDSKLSRKYIILIDANVLNHPLRGNDGNLIILQAV